jgi:hypothetical protein
MTRRRHPPLTDLDIDELIASPQVERIMAKNDTTWRAWRALKQLYFDRRDLRGKVMALEALTGASETKHVDRLEQRR